MFKTFTINEFYLFGTDTEMIHMLFSIENDTDIMLFC